MLFKMLLNRQFPCLVSLTLTLVCKELSLFLLYSKYIPGKGIDVLEIFFSGVNPIRSVLCLIQTIACGSL